jgi:hypothetical protein
MRTFRDPDDAIRAWLEEGPLVLPDQVERAIGVATRPMSQERPTLRRPWRFLTMTMSPKLVAGGAAVIAVTLGGVLLLGQRSSAPDGGVGVLPTPAPAATDAPSASASPTTSASVLDTSQWDPFVSPRYGFTSAFPTSFYAKPSTAFWTLPEEPSSGFDAFFGGPGTNSWVASSMRLPAGVTADAWIDAYRQVQIDASPGEDIACHTPPEAWTPVTIDGQAASLRLGCGVLEALLVVDDRVYSFGGWTEASSTPGVPAEFRALFDAWLTTIRLDPASALDPPVASPSPS